MGAPDSQWTWSALLMVVVLAAVEASYFSEFQRQENSVCWLKDGSTGVCLPFGQCPIVLAPIYHHNPTNLCSAGVCCRQAARGPSQFAAKHWERWNSRAPIHQTNNGNGHRFTFPTFPTFHRFPKIPTQPTTAHSSIAPPTTPSTAFSSTSPPTAGKLMLMKMSGGEISRRACEVYSDEVSRFPIGLIYNGQKVQPGEFPHMALLGYRPKGQTTITWNCGGSLISRRFVLSAAHCFTNLILRTPVQVRLGEHDLLVDDDNAVDYAIKSWKTHPEYRTPSWYHDLALLELDRDVVFTQYIQPACLWSRPQDPPTGLIVTGWGATENDGPSSTVLLKGNGTLKRVDPKDCTWSFRAATLQLQDGIQDGILCAVDEEEGVDTCQGDSGGPIQVESDVSVSYYVVGVVSGGVSVCGARFPSINIRVYKYLDWIEDTVWPDGNF